MSFADWKDKTAGFKKIDVRGVAGNFFPGLKKQAMELPVGSGLEVVQTFKPSLDPHVQVRLALFQKLQEGEVPCVFRQRRVPHSDLKLHLCARQDGLPLREEPPRAGDILRDAHAPVHGRLRVVADDVDSLAARYDAGAVGAAGISTARGSPPKLGRGSPSPA